MNPLLRWYQYALLGMGLQATMTVASEFGPRPLVGKKAPAPTPTPTTSCFARRHPTTTADTNRVLAFAGAPHSTRLIRDNGSDRPNSMIFNNSIRSRSRRATTRMFMLSSENREVISTIASLSFWPDVSYINEIVTWILGISFMFMGASLLASKSNEERGQQQQQQLAMVTTSTSGIDVDVNENLTDVLLTPGTYADSNSAERLVTDTVVAKAPEAFDTTDFDNEPHLSPELEDVEAAFEVALLANAAHAMADAAEKENRQSRAAMLEREKELEWIESHDEGESNGGMIGSSSSIGKEMFQRSLLAAQLANKSTRRAKKQEAFQRSLLSSRIAYDVKSKESVLEVQHIEEATESEFRTSSVGEVNDLQDGVEEVAASAAEGDYEEKVEHVVGMTVHEAAQISESDERIIIGDDSVTAEHVQFVEEAMQVDTTDDSVEIDNAQPIVQAKPTSVQDQWRKDSVQAVRKYIHQKAIEKTKQKMLLRNNDVDKISPVEVDNVVMINTADEDQSTEISGKEISFESESSSVMKLFNTRALMRRMPRRRRLLVVALGLVITRRLFLAYFGNALSVI